MPNFQAYSPAWKHFELPIVVGVAWAVFVSIPISLGHIGLSWDALNHHIYLGWTAEQQRFDKDFWAASSQSYQFPYLYWPAYKLATMGLSGVAAGVVLATLHTFAVPPVWMVAKTCIPGYGLFESVMRFAAVALAFLTGVVVSLFDSTQNDLLASIPLLWAMALAIWTIRSDTEPYYAERRTRGFVLISGVLAGTAVALKLSNGPLALVMPILWAANAVPFRKKFELVVIGGASTLLGCALLYGPWGWQLIQHYGNPIYPMYFSVFEALGWKP